jgi:hypothetical protein
MDFNRKLETLKEHATEAQKSAAAAAKESRDKMRTRITQARVDADLAAKDVKQKGGEKATESRNKWAQLKTDTSAKMADIHDRLEQRDAKMDAKMANKDAEWAEADAADAISYATWAADNARLAVLDALDARLHAEELAQVAAR